MGSEKPKQPVTLQSVAKATGYSVNTVSRALRGKDGLSKTTRESIRKTADEMGYVNNMIASSLRLGYTNTIAVLLGDISNPHFAIMMKEIEERARQCGYSSFLINTNEDTDIEREAIRSALNKSVDGIIICPTQQNQDNIRYLMNAGVPFVLMGRHFDDIETDYVVCDDVLGGYQATKALIEAGHRRILMLSGPAYISSARERVEGYCKALREAGLPVDKRLILGVDVTNADCAGIARDMASGKLDCTAVFAFSDLIVWSLWDSLAQLGQQVPRDYSLIGFDHIQSRLPVPGHLSTISSFKGRMSVAAVDILVEKMKHTSTAVQQIVIESKLVEGDTIASPKG